MKLIPFLLILALPMFCQDTIPGFHLDADCPVDSCTAIETDNILIVLPEGDTTGAPARIYSATDKLMATEIHGKLKIEKGFKREDVIKLVKEAGELYKADPLNNVDPGSPDPDSPDLQSNDSSPSLVLIGQSDLTIQSFDPIGTCAPNETAVYNQDQGTMFVCHSNKWEPVTSVPTKQDPSRPNHPLLIPILIIIGYLFSFIGGAAFMVLLGSLIEGYNPEDIEKHGLHSRAQDARLETDKELD